MSYTPVINSNIISRKTLTTEFGRTCFLFHLFYEGFEYMPGQFVMIQLQDGGFQWSYPYMIYEKTMEGFLVLSSEYDSLSSCTEGDTVCIWGANGKGCETVSRSLFFAEPASYYLLAPLVHACPNALLVLIGKQGSVPEEILPEHTTWVTDCRTANSCLSVKSANIFIALNLPILKELMGEATADVKERSFLFVSTRIGCGIGACKSCYLHSPDIHVGIPVCCNGPYLPYHTIDFEKDEKCFQAFK